MKRLLCWLLGHDVLETGRRAYSLWEVQCLRCRRRFVGCDGHGYRLLDLDPDFDKLLRMGTR